MSTEMPRHEMPREYKTARLLLRPPRAEDVDDVFAYASLDGYTEYLNIPRPYTRKHAEERIALELSEEWAKGPTYALCFHSPRHEDGEGRGGEVASDRRHQHRHP